MLPDAVLQKLDALPAQPGVYLFKDKKGAVVYVGKAKSLRSRVRSYFQDAQGDSRAFIPILQRTIGDLETIVTANEKEATILENNLIKEYRPRYNVKLRDDKDFITLRLGAAEVSQVGVRGPAPETPTLSLLFGALRRSGLGSRSCAGRPPTGRGTSARITRPRRHDARCTSSTSTSSSGPAATSSSRAGSGRACSTRSSAARRLASCPSIAACTPSRSTPWPSSSRGATTSCRASSTHA